MKRKIWLWASLLLIFVLPSTVFSEDLPRRNATKVQDVFESYTVDEWIISPDEEETDDQTPSSLTECDIRGIIACYDKNYLRVDFLLSDSVTYKYRIFYALKFEYTENTNEYYTYYPDTKDLIYEKEVNGEVVETKYLTDKNSDDFAGVTSSGQKDNDDVYLIINKGDHISGKRGSNYFLTTCFISGYIDTNDKMQFADQTDWVELQFER